MSGNCAKDLITGFCGLLFPPCTENTPTIHLPRSACNQACQQVLNPDTGSCKDYLSIFRSLPQFTVPDCETDIFGKSGWGTCVTSAGTSCVSKEGIPKYRPEYPEGYIGQKMFQNFTSYHDKATGQNISVQCFDWADFKEIEVVVGECNEPTVESPLYGQESCPDWFEVPVLSPDGSGDFTFKQACDIPCLLPCPFTYMSSKQEIHSLWSLYITIGFVALVACILPFLSHTAGKRQHIVNKSTVPLKVVEMLFLCLLYLLVEVVPSAAMYTDIQCQITVLTGSGQGIICSIQRGSVHFLQACYYLLTSLLIEMVMKMSNANIPQKTIGKVMHIASYVIPTICLVCTYSLSSVATRYPLGYYELWGWNYLKDPFRCTVQFQTTTQEWVFVHGHFVILGFVIVGLCFWVIQKVLAASVKANIRSKNKNKEWILIGMYRRLVKARLTKLVAVCTQVTIVIAMQLAVSIELNRVLKDFSSNMEEWTRCSWASTSLRGAVVLSLYLLLMHTCIKLTESIDGIDSFVP
jgi:hypothetical protein